MPDKIDFSKMERLTPRADSWEKVCARLDAEEVPVEKFVSIKSWYSAIPLAASFVIVSLTAILPDFTDDVAAIDSTEYVSINSSAPEEVLSWYSNLGNSGDEFETLEQTVGLSYLIKE